MNENIKSITDKSSFCFSRKLLVQCDSEGFLHNCLVPLRHYLPSPGGPLKYSLEGHRFAIFSCCVSTDKRYVVSVSNKYVPISQFLLFQDIQNNLGVHATVECDYKQHFKACCRLLMSPNKRLLQQNNHIFAICFKICIV